MTTNIGLPTFAPCKLDLQLYGSPRVSVLSRVRTLGKRKFLLVPPVASLSSSLNSSQYPISAVNDVDDSSPGPPVNSCIWKWKGFSIRYQCCGDTGPALVLIHGFGANSDHWRKNLGALGKSHRVYAIDLIGYGYSDKPNPRDFGDTPFYTFDTWASQLNDFCREVAKDNAFFICNSIGGLVGLQAAVMEPNICRGLLLVNISLRMLHIKKQSALARPLIKSFQSILRDTVLGKYFFGTVATNQSVKNILCQCYHDTSQVTDELVEKILLPGLQPGAVDVFLEFICYSDGPLPEELLPQVKCPVLIAWGDKDPWEPIALGRAYGEFQTVEDFVVLPDVGHCPQDEAPQLVNPLIESFVARHVWYYKYVGDMSFIYPKISQVYGLSNRSIKGVDPQGNGEFASSIQCLLVRFNV